MADLRREERDSDEEVHTKTTHRQQGCSLCPLRQAYHEYEGLYYRPYYPSLKRRFNYDRKLSTCTSKVQPN